MKLLVRIRCIATYACMKSNWLVYVTLMLKKRIFLFAQFKLLDDHAGKQPQMVSDACLI